MKYLRQILVYSVGTKGTHD